MALLTPSPTLVPSATLVPGTIAGSPVVEVPITSPLVGVLMADGVNLDSLAQSVGVDSNRWAVPGAKGENVLAPARHGSLYVADKTFLEGEFVLDITVQGANDSGQVAFDELAQARSNIDRLLRIFTKRKKLIYFTQSYPDGSSVECYAECTGTFDVTRSSSALPFAKMKVAFKIPSAFWQDSVTREFVSAPGLTQNQVLRIPPFEGGTAPMDDAVYIVYGPITDPELYVSETGAFTRLNGTVPQGHKWRVDASKWSSVRGPSVSFESSGDPSVIGLTVHAGSASFMDLPPITYNQFAIELGGTNMGASTQLAIRGRRKFLIS